ncbi:hypothetical protein [Microbacterium sp.]|uniref:hypothetical protein n=1 Tax=Microbacterium sp. TaxID=51671 RepID=UPI0037CBFF2D
MARTTARTTDATTSTDGRAADARRGAVWRLGALGAVAGVAWAAGLRAYMAELESISTVSWVGTFVAILLPGAICGALLGVAEARRRAGRTRGLRWFALAPLAFAVVTLALPGALWTFLTTGLGGGALAVPVMGIAGGFALGQSGPLWSRIAAGVVSVLLLAGMIATVPTVGGLPLTTPRGAWIAVLISSLLVVLAAASSIPFRRARIGAHD